MNCPNCVSWLRRQTGFENARFLRATEARCSLLVRKRLLGLYIFSELIFSFFFLQRGNKSLQRLKNMRNLKKLRRFEKSTSPKSHPAKLISAFA